MVLFTRILYRKGVLNICKGIETRSLYVESERLSQKVDQRMRVRGYTVKSPSVKG